MRNITVRVFKHLDITSDIDVDKKIKYTQRIFRETEVKKPKQVFSWCKESVNGLSRDQWSKVVMKDVAMKQFWTWANIDNIDGLVNM